MTLSMFSAIQSSTQTPGPGAYEDDKLHSVGGTLSLKMKIHERFTQTPKYISNAKYVAPRSSLSKESHTIGRLFKAKEEESSVGPCFLPNPMSNFSHGVTIKKRYPKKDNNGTPGPGKYSPKDPVHTSVPAQRNRGPLKLAIIPDSPGPAAYDVDRNFSKDALSFSIRPRTAYSVIDDENPGYEFNNPSQLGRDSRKSGFGKATRVTNYETIAPGPGAYDVEIPRNTKIGPYIHQNIEEVSRSANSSDQLYDVREYPNIKRKTISPQCGISACDPTSDTPGPSYLPNTTLELRPLSVHLKFDSKITQHTPGPGDYTPMSPGGMIRLSCTMKGPSDRTWFSPDDDNPGPAAYAVEMDNEAPKWTIGERSISRRNKTRSSLRPTTTQTYRRKSISDDKNRFSSTAPVGRKQL